jgi:hypothetical protein
VSVRYACCAGVLAAHDSGISVRAVVSAAAIEQGWECVQCSSCTEQQAMSVQLSSASTTLFSTHVPLSCGSMWRSTASWPADTCAGASGQFARWNKRMTLCPLLHIPSRSKSAHAANFSAQYTHSTAHGHCLRAEVDLLTPDLKSGSTYYIVCSAIVRKLVTISLLLVHAPLRAITHAAPPALKDHARSSMCPGETNPNPYIGRKCAPCIIQ